MGWGQMDGDWVALRPSSNVASPEPARYLMPRPCIPPSDPVARTRSLTRTLACTWPHPRAAPSGTVRRQTFSVGRTPVSSEAIASTAAAAKGPPTALWTPGPEDEAVKTLVCAATAGGYKEAEAGAC
jgi:hypothetical protein